MSTIAKKGKSNPISGRAKQKKRKASAPLPMQKAKPIDSPDPTRDSSHSPNILKDALDNWEAFKQSQLQELGEDKYRKLFKD